MRVCQFRHFGAGSYRAEPRSMCWQPCYFTGASRPSPVALARGSVGFVTTVCGAGVRTIFLQLVVKGLQADAQDFRRLGLVIVSRFKRLQDEQALGLVHRRADSEMD